MLPGDDLLFDTRCPSQSLLSGVREKERNEATSGMDVLYVAGSPRIESDADFVHTWSNPQINGGVGSTSASTELGGVPSPYVQDALDYMKAFYHGMDVKMLSPFYKLGHRMFRTIGSKNNHQNP